MYPCLWFNNQASEAATFYCSVFKNSTITSNNPIVTKFKIEGTEVMALNGGPQFNINPSISFFVTFLNEEEIDSTWNKMLDGATPMMALNKYPWAEKYGWIKDKYGMTWQFILDASQTEKPKIIESFLFVGKNYGKAYEAVQHYQSIFKNSKIIRSEFYEENEPQPKGNLKFAEFSLNDTVYAAMDGIGDHQFEFNEGVSIVVECDTQEEIDYYWEKLTEDGQESMCGWLKDKYGVSWQIVPSILGSLMSNPDKGQKVMQAFLKMKKFDINTLLNV